MIWRNLMAIWALHTIRAAIRRVPRDLAGGHWQAFTVCFLGLCEAELALQRGMVARVAVQRAIRRAQKGASRDSRSSQKTAAPASGEPCAGAGAAGRTSGPE